PAVPVHLRWSNLARRNPIRLFHGPALFAITLYAGSSALASTSSGMLTQCISINLGQPHLVFAINIAPFGVLLWIAQLSQQRLEGTRVLALKLEIGDEVVVRRLDGVARVIELAIDLLRILGANCSVADLLALFLKKGHAFICGKCPPLGVLAN